MQLLGLRDTGKICDVIISYDITSPLKKGLLPMFLNHLFIY